MPTSYSSRALIHDGVWSQIFRARRDTDGVAVILKVLRSDTATAAERNRLIREHDRITGVQSGAIVQAHGLENIDGRLTLVLEDFGGESLHLHVQRARPDLVAVLRMGVQLSEAIAALHAHGLVHKDLNPQNIIIHPITGQLKLTDFGIAQRLTLDGRERVASDRAEGTVPYMAPEQSGRIHRTVDYRTDFYALGVTLYELLTGRLPFVATDPLEVIAAHIARRPEPVHVVEPDVPEGVSAIIARLLEKAAEDRYQSATGLHADLQHCLRQLDEIGQILPFELGRRDIPSTFRVAQRLYGRGAQLQALARAIEPSEGANGPRLVLISGPAGIGKSSLIHEVRRPLAMAHGLFGTGKFDVMQQHVPLVGLAAAVAGLVRSILTEPDAVVTAWRERLLAAVGNNAGVLVDLVPELGGLLGPQPPVPDLGPLEAQQRLHMTFGDFLRALAGPEQPLVLFLDDLQWADGASLALLQAWLTDPETAHVLILGAWRDHEVDAAHRLTEALQSLESRGVAIERMPLEPIAEADVLAMVADTLYADAETVASLAQVVYAKTSGNPFFVHVFLRALHEEGAITYDPALGWRWDAGRAAELQATANVVDMMVTRLERLPADALDVLQRASCLGTRFPLALLAVACGLDETATAMALDPALVDGFVHLRGDHAWFAHDRVREAAHAMLGDRAERVHLAVGRALLTHLGDGEAGERVFDIVGHLNKAGSALEPALWPRLARLNLEAGMRALEAGAYDVALDCLTRGIAALGPQPWQDDYALARDLHLGRLSCEYLNKRHDEFEQQFASIVPHLRAKAEQAQAWRLMVTVRVTQGRMTDAVSVGCTALRQLFGVKVPQGDKPVKLAMLAEVVQAKFRLRGKSIAALVDLPELTDPDRRALMQLMAEMFPAAFISNPMQFVWMVCHLTNLSLKHGKTDVTPQVFLPFTQVLGGALKDYDSAHQFGQMALAMNQKYGSAWLEGKLHFMFAWFCGHWKQHADVAIEHGLTSFRRGSETGDLVFASYGLLALFHAKLTVGRPLAEIRKDLEKYAPVLRRMGDRVAMFYILHVFQNAVRNLQGEAADPLVFEHVESPEWAEDRVEATLRGQGQLNLLMFYWLYRLQIAYTLGQLDVAHGLIGQMHPLLDAVMGELAQAEYHFYRALTLLALARQAQPRERKALIAATAGDRKLLALWAKHAPENFEHKHLLVEAELAWLAGRATDASLGYRTAATSARRARYTQHEALAHERAGRFHLEGGDQTAALAHLTEARNAWERWGATVKVKALHAEFPQQIAAPGKRRGSGTVALTSDEFGAGELDVQSLIKALQAVSGEIKQEQLQAQLLRIVAENAGAERVCLVREEAGRLMVVAEQRVGQPEQDTPYVPQPLEAGVVSPAVVKYVARTADKVVLHDACHEGLFAQDPVVLAQRVRSLLCIPIVYQGKPSGILYLDNTLMAGVFTPGRLEVLEMLSAQAAISMENARLYQILEEKVEERTRQLQAERDKSEQLLRNILPDEIAAELKEKGSVAPMHYKAVTILFTDFTGFTAAAATMRATELIRMLDGYFTQFDAIIERHGLEKLKTIGDAYMCAGGLPRPNARHHLDACLAALEIRQLVAGMRAVQQQMGVPALDVRIGIHTGPAVAGVIGRNKYAYDVWGDTVNIASRMESTGVPGQINVSHTTWTLVHDFFETEHRGQLAIKNRGEQDMYLLRRLKPEFSANDSGTQVNARVDEALVLRNAPRFTSGGILLPEPAADPSARTPYEQIHLTEPDLVVGEPS
jgi:predicted ATPase/class 3 adenylate cyclase